MECQYLQGEQPPHNRPPLTLTKVGVGQGLTGIRVDIVDAAVFVSGTAAPAEFPAVEVAH